MLALQDWLLFWGHVALVVFNVTGWIFPRTRLLHLATFGLTACSWFVLGAVYGWGYCICTDYHAEVLARLGDPNANITFIQLMFKRLLGLSIGQPLADYLAVAVFVFITIATTCVWARTWHQRQNRRRLSVGLE